MSSEKMLEAERRRGIETQVSSTLPELTVTQYLYPFQRPPGTHRADNIYIERISIKGNACWAIRCFGERLVRYGHRYQWEFEPSPSDRSEEWKDRAAFTLPDAVKALEETLNPLMPAFQKVIKP